MLVNLIAAPDTFADQHAAAWQRRFFARRGHHVTLCTPAAPTAPTGPPPADLYIYHYPAAGSLLATLSILDRGVAILDCRQLPPNAVTDPGFTHLAALSDLIVLPSQADAAALTGDAAAGQASLIASTVVHIVAPAVALTEFSPGPANPDFLRRQGWLDRTLLLTAAPSALLDAALERVRTQIPHVTLVGLPAAADSVARRNLYRHAALYLALPGDPAAPLYALEAMACGAPVLAISDPADPLAALLDARMTARPDDPDDLAARIVGLLADETRYAAAVLAGLACAAAHSQAHYDQQWSAVLAAASVWLPNRVTLTPAATSPIPVAAPTAPAAAPEPTAWSPGPTLARLKSAAAVTLKDYRVRSAIPYAGPLIVWVRRNLTSHLREPYLDPVLQRQEVFNWQAAQAVEELARQLAALEQGAAETTDEAAGETAAFYAELERCLAELAAGLATLAGHTDPPDAGAWAALRRQLEAAHTLLARRPPPA